jgi:hypothetical protein
MGFVSAGGGPASGDIAVSPHFAVALIHPKSAAETPENAHFRRQPQLAGLFHTLAAFEPTQ